MRFYLSLILIFGFFGLMNAQDTTWARKQINILAADEMHGRGYTNQGELKAARHIIQEFRKMGLQTFSGDFMQEYFFPINSFTDSIILKADGKDLIAGQDFMVSLSSPGLKGEFDVVALLNDSIPDSDAFKKLKNTDLSNKALLIDHWHKEMLATNPLGAKIILYCAKEGKRLIWSVSNGHELNNFVTIKLTHNAIAPDTKSIELNLTNKFMPEYKSRNLAAFVPGKSDCDSMIVFTAHYDHLGEMGNGVIFNGANDNGSGTVMVMMLAKYFAQPENQPDCPVAFFLFSGEESGLMGSTFMAENPIFPLEKIRYLINLDMVGTGSEGITVVNGATEPLFDKLSEINEEHSLLAEVKPRGVSCNSDHCPFSKKGVPAVFIYTRGPEFMEYHNIYDRPENLPMTAFWELGRLMIELVRFRP